MTELLLRLFSEPFDLILAQDRRVVSPWMQGELILALGGVLGLFVVMVAAFFRSGTPIVTYAWRILNRVVDVWTRPVGSRQRAQNAARLNRPLGAAIFPIVGLGLALHRLTGLGHEAAGALYFGVAAWMEWTGWRPDALSGKARATPSPDAG